MLLIGFDAAAQPEKFGYAIGSLGRGRIKVTDCGVLKCKAEPDALEARVFPALQHAD
jgi:hypothetical protein